MKLLPVINLTEDSLRDEFNHWGDCDIVLRDGLLVLSKGGNKLGSFDEIRLYDEEYGIFVCKEDHSYFIVNANGVISEGFSIVADEIFVKGSSLFVGVKRFVLDTGKMYFNVLCLDDYSYLYSYNVGVSRGNRIPSKFTNRKNEIKWPMWDELVDMDGEITIIKNENGFVFFKGLCLNASPIVSSVSDFQRLPNGNYIYASECGEDGSLSYGGIFAEGKKSHEPCLGFMTEEELQKMACDLRAVPAAKTSAEVHDEPVSLNGADLQGEVISFFCIGTGGRVSGNYWVTNRESYCLDDKQRPLVAWIDPSKALVYILRYERPNTFRFEHLFDWRFLDEAMYGHSSLQFVPCHFEYVDEAHLLSDLKLALDNQFKEEVAEDAVTVAADEVPEVSGDESVEVPNFAAAVKSLMNDLLALAPKEKVAEALDVLFHDRVLELKGLSKCMVDYLNEITPEPSVAEVVDEGFLDEVGNYFATVGKLEDFTAMRNYWAIKRHSAYEVLKQLYTEELIGEEVQHVALQLMKERLHESQQLTDDQVKCCFRLLVEG